MGVSNHTPDPAAGALIYASGVIVLPDDNESAKADNIRLGDEQLADLMAFMTGGETGDINYKITGNGEPPAGGYTPTTNRIRIGGTGLETDIAISGWSKKNGTIDPSLPVFGVNTVMSPVWTVIAPSSGVSTYYPDDSGAEDGDEVTIVAYQIPGAGAAVNISDLAPPAGTPFVSFAEGYGSATIRRIGGSWRLNSFCGTAPTIGVP